MASCGASTVACILRPCDVLDVDESNLHLYMSAIGQWNPRTNPQSFSDFCRALDDPRLTLLKRKHYRIVERIRAEFDQWTREDVADAMWAAQELGPVSYVAQRLEEYRRWAIIQQSNTCPTHA